MHVTADNHRTSTRPGSDPESLRSALAQISRELAAGELAVPGAARLSSRPDGIHAVRSVLAAAPRSAWPRLAIAFNADQVDSKLWLIENLARTVDAAGHRAVILGAWYGILAFMMDQVLPRPPEAFVCVDLDPAACTLAERLLSIVSSPVEVRCADMLQVDYTGLCAERPTIFINTSCEHVADFAGWRQRVPAGARLVLQSNDHRGCSEHVNCVPDVNALERQCRLSQVDFRGTLQLARFKRFMLIGRA